MKTDIVLVEHNGTPILTETLEIGEPQVMPAQEYITEVTAP